MDNTQKTNREKERVQKNNISRETEGERERWNKNERTEQWKREKKIQEREEKRLKRFKGNERNNIKAIFIKINIVSLDVSYNSYCCNYLQVLPVIFFILKLNK